VGVARGAGVCSRKRVRLGSRRMVDEGLLQFFFSGNWVLKEGRNSRGRGAGHGGVLAFVAGGGCGDGDGREVWW